MIFWILICLKVELPTKFCCIIICVLNQWNSRNTNSKITLYISHFWGNVFPQKIQNWALNVVHKIQQSLSGPDSKEYSWPSTTFSETGNCSSVGDFCCKYSLHCQDNWNKRLNHFCFGTQHYFHVVLNLMSKMMHELLQEYHLQFITTESAIDRCPTDRANIPTLLDGDIFHNSVAAQETSQLWDLDVKYPVNPFTRHKIWRITWCHNKNTPTSNGMPICWECIDETSWQRYLQSILNHTEACTHFRCDDATTIWQQTECHYVGCWGYDKASEWGLKRKNDWFIAKANNSMQNMMAEHKYRHKNGMIVCWEYTMDQFYSDCIVTIINIIQNAWLQAKYDKTLRLLTSSWRQVSWGYNVSE